jgi:uncharacterized Rmd1/YagE family protein
MVGLAGEPQTSFAPVTARAAETLNRKLSLIGQTARLLADLIDTERSQRMEPAIVVLIVGEIALTLFQMSQGWAR